MAEYAADIDVKEECVSDVELAITDIKEEDVDIPTIDGGSGGSTVKAENDAQQGSHKMEDLDDVDTTTVSVAYELDYLSSYSEDIKAPVVPMEQKKTNLKEEGDMDNGSNTAVVSSAPLTFQRCKVEAKQEQGGAYTGSGIVESVTVVICPTEATDTPLTGIKLFTCDFCEYTSNLPGYTKSHMMTHTGEKPFACEICEYKCRSSGMLNAHKVIHTSERPFECDVCGLKFKRLTALKWHKKTHTGFNCHICGYKCKTQRTLREHTRTHKKEPPRGTIRLLECNFCDHKSSRGSHMKLHMRTHTGEKPFPCDVCDYKAISRFSLVEHMRVHTGEKPYACSLCDYRCAQPKYLRHHARTHTGEKPYSCDVCDYKGAVRSTIVRHI